MAKLNINISGRRGLLERHQGDLNDTTPQQNLRYTGEDGQFADGIFNPMKVFGYLNPANNKFATLTGTIADGLNSIQYDAAGDIVYLSEGGENILKLDGLDDTSVSNYLSITAGWDIKDMVIYEANGKKSLVYVIDSNAPVIYAPGNTGVNAGGMYLGFKTIDTTEGITLLEKNAKELVTSGNLWEFTIDDGSGFNVGFVGRKLSQQFSSTDIAGRRLSGVSLSLRRKAGTGVGITMKVSIQGDATASTGIYTSRGAWSNAVVNYVVNDTVTDGGFTYQCILAHSAAGVINDEPGVGSNYKTYWEKFGSPDGTDLASKTFLLSSIPVLGQNGAARVNFEFTSAITLGLSGNYWIVIEEVGTNMTGADQLATLYATSTTSLYAYKLKEFRDAAVDHWRNLDATDDATLTTMDFRLISNRDDTWSLSRGSLSDILGYFTVDTGQSSFLYLADNALLYWFVGNKVHTLDGGITGGAVGRANQEVLSFPSYLSVPDVAETRSRMYIGVQGSNITNATDSRVYTPNTCGVYVWDRRSQVIGGGDFYEASGAKEIKKLFKSSTGDIKCITVGNSGFSEVRGIVGNQFGVLHTFEKDGYPKSRRSVSQIDDMTIWLGANGIIYGYGAVAPGEPEQLYKLGTISAEYTGTLTAGPIMVGHKEATEPRTGVFLAWTATGGSAIKLQKWYPHGDGTIGAVAQVANQGDVYTKVYDFGYPVNVRWGHIMFVPISGGTSTQTVATIKVYYNKSTTAGSTFTIKRKDLTKGYYYMPIGEKNAFAIQFEIEWDVTQTLGSTDFMPNDITVDYDEVKMKKK